MLISADILLVLRGVLAMRKREGSVYVPRTLYHTYGREHSRAGDNSEFRMVEEGGHP